jgi:hypothetical protein
MKLRFFTVLWSGGKAIEDSKVELDIKADPYIFGRESSCDCHVPIATASRFQASLCCVDGQWFLYDGVSPQKSANGIFYGATRKDAIGISALLLADKLSSEIFIARSNGDRLELVVEWVDRDEGRDTLSFDLNQQLEQKIVIATEEINKIRQFGEAAIEADRLRREEDKKFRELMADEMKALKESQKISQRNDRWMAYGFILVAMVFAFSARGIAISDQGKQKIEDFALNTTMALITGAIGASSLMGKTK